MKLDRLSQLKRELDKARRKFNQERTPSVIVGYEGVNYAIYVHEAVEMKLKGEKRPGKRVGKRGKAQDRGYYWDPQGQAQAKFLEEPARNLANSGQLSQILTSSMARGVKLDDALVACGLRIQRESVPLVPVDTGNLKGSSFVRKE